MSWTPTFFVKKKDFYNFKSSICAIDSDDLGAWEFSIDGVQGVVISAGESSYSNRELHDVIKGLPHWILNGEGEACGNCHDWGDKIELDEE